MPALSETEYAEFVRFVLQLTGIVLDDGKRYLVETRIGPILETQKIPGYSRLLEQAKSNISLQGKIIDAITTNETFFFREPGAYDLFRRRLMPKVLDQRTEAKSKDPMRVWSAACSSGQEMYSLVISALELIGNLAFGRITFDGTDISEQILSRASSGLYSSFEISRGMPPNLLSKYFTKTADSYKISDIVRGMCRFNKANLLHPPMMTQRYDVIFCRNVSIYFSPQERSILFHNLAKNLVVGGALVVGSTEQVRDCDDVFRLSTDFSSCYYYQRI
ncbi:MAG TPA: protein-glutamate O-methyltransferase CheR [Fibrobacteraceae bacterium]|nr:protein-glutamate O-methyltransferase CheR [Fibrobacteraceae bacterium]